MKNFPRVAAAVTSAMVVAGGAVLFGSTAAHGYPSSPSNQAGSVNYNFVDPLTATVTQISPGAVILFSNDDSLDLAVNETLRIVQSDPAMLLQVRYTGASPIEWDGNVIADANVMFTSPAGFIIDGAVYAGGDLMLSTGEAAFTVAGPVLEPTFTPLATDGALTLTTDADVTAEGQVGIFGDVVTVTGSVRALGGEATVASTGQAQWARFSAGTPFLVSGGLAGGAVNIDGDVTAPDAEILTPDPSTQSIDGTVRGTRSGGAGSASVAMSVNGVATDFRSSAVTGGAGELADLGSHASVGDQVPLAFTSVTLGTEGSGAVPEDSTAVISGLAIDEGFTIDIIQARCLIEDGFETHVAIGGDELDGAPILPDDYDLTIPNQPAFDLGGGTSVAFNVQETAIIDGYEVRTVTAVRVSDATDSTSFGVVECALPAVPEQPVLAATGANRADAQLGIAGAVMLALTGVVLLIGRRRRNT